MNTIRRVSTGHLVFGLVFLGITAIWVVGETTDVEAPALAIWGPVVLIAAGAVGLASTLFNSRQARIDERRRFEEHPAQTTHLLGEDQDVPVEPHETAVEDTAVLDREEQR